LHAMAGVLVPEETVMPTAFDVLVAKVVDPA
jgi:hypothetical protein